MLIWVEEVKNKYGQQSRWKCEEMQDTTNLQKCVHELLLLLIVTADSIFTLI